MKNPSGGENRASELVGWLRSGDPRGAELLVARSRLFAWYFNHMRGIPQGDAEDLACDLVFDVVSRKIDYYKGDGRGFWAWVHAVMRNMATDWWRAHEGKLDEPLPEHMVAPQGSGDDTDEDSVSGPGGLLFKTLETALCSFPPRDRRLFEAKVLGGLSDLEIGREFQITANAVKQRFFRIKGRLKRALTPFKTKPKRIGG